MEGGKVKKTRGEKGEEKEKKDTIYYKRLSGWIIPFIGGGKKLAWKLFTGSVGQK